MNETLDILLQRIMFSDFRGNYNADQQQKLIKGLNALIKNVEIRPQLLEDMYQEND